MIAFSKYHGAGNDFILIDIRSSFLPQEPETLALRLCDRHKGIGADGLLLICPSSVAFCKMRIFNPDGSEAAMCGNGIRCVFAYLRKNRETLIETRSGIFTCRSVGEEVAVDFPPPQVLHWPIEIEGKEVFVVNTGVPHAVLFVTDVRTTPVAAWGMIIRSHPQFAPEGVNVNFASFEEGGKILLRTFERGVGETLACGTGAAATAFVAKEHFKISSPIQIETRTSFVSDPICFTPSLSFVSDCLDIRMQGPAQMVFSGTIDC